MLTTNNCHKLPIVITQMNASEQFRQPGTANASIYLKREQKLRH